MRELTWAIEVIPHTLPATPTDLVGRTREIGELGAMLTTKRLITLTGPPGSGKTRLAIETARDNLGAFQDGVWFVSLAAITDATLVVPAMAQTMSLPLDETAGAAGLARRLRDQRMLIVLDNVEQVLEAADGVAEILAGAAGVRVLATSRAPLRIDAEQEYMVQPLSVPAPDGLGPRPEDTDSVRLFALRAQSIRSDFTLDDGTSGAVAEICRRVDGLPLAIELAAARIRILEPRALLEHLDARLIDIANPSRSAAARHRSLRAAIEWSYDLLDDPAKTLFRGLSVFVGGWTADAARRVCDRGPDRDVMTTIEALVASSLVAVETSPRTRFTMLETLREFGLETTARSGERAVLERRHGSYFADLVERLAPDLTTRSQRQAIDTLEVERDNVRAALTWAIEAGESEIAHRIAAGMWRFWQQRGHIAEGRTWLERVLGMRMPATPTVRAAALSAAGGLAYWASDLEASRALNEAAVEIWRADGNQRQLGRAIYDLASIELIPRGSLSENPSATQLRQAIDLAVAADDPVGAARATWCLGVLALMSNDIPEGIGLLDESIGSLRALDAPFDLGWALHNRGLADLVPRSDLTRAHAYFDEALSSFATMGDIAGCLFVLDDLAQLATVEEDFVRARRLAGAAAGIRGRSDADLAAFSERRAHLGRALMNLDERAQPGDSEPLRKAWDEGLGLSMDEAIVAARSRDAGDQLSRIRVRAFVLGPFRVEIDGVQIDDWGAAKSGGRQAQALFAMLLDRRDRGVTKDDAIDLIWPDRDLPQAEAAFHRTISGLRTLFRSASDSVVAHVNGRYVLDSHAVDWVDLDAFEDRLSAMGLGLLDGSAVSSLEEARSLYRGGYLEDVPFYGDAGTVEEVRERSRRSLVDALISLGRRYEARGERSRAGDRYREALRLAGTDSPAAREALRRMGLLVQ
jgi:predicted ATPase/DNA-binding SARP family transcriptional activator